MAVDDSYTKSLLHFNGADASTTIIDESGKVWTARGAAQLDSAQYKFGNASLLLNGTDAYVDTPDNDDFTLSDENWTFDFWVNYSAISKNQAFFEQFTNSQNYHAFYINSTNSLRFFAISGNSIKANYTYTWGVSENTWYHIEIARDGSTLRTFIDGAAITWSVTTGIGTSSLVNSTGNFRVGYHSYDGGTSRFYHNGRIDEFRFSKGVVRHTSNFTPPSAEYGPSGNWFLLQKRNGIYNFAG